MHDLFNDKGNIHVGKLCIWSTFTYLTSRSNGYIGFAMGKRGSIGFSESFVACEFGE